MAVSFFFYDLETSGFSPRSARIMQFGGQRTDMNLKPIGDPVNILIRLTPDVLPSPDAIMITGITPQKTVSEGITEAAFLKYFHSEIVLPNTTFIGFNSIRFDDEFMRFLHYRNFYDAYEWQWKDGCSRWDLLDVVRMTRALRPDGIQWPFAPDGKPANRLEFLTSVNKLDHSDAHDALSDVRATIAVAELIREKQKDLFDYLFKHRDKKSVKAIVSGGTPFTYTSGRYSSQYLHTTAAIMISAHPEQDAALVYDLRFDPTDFLQMTPEQLAEAWKFTKDPDVVQLPVKTLKYNRCPAVAPLGVMSDAASQERLELSPEIINRHLALIKQHQKEFARKLADAVRLLDKKREQISLVEDELTVDERLYDGFANDEDKSAMRAVRAAQPDELSSIASSFSDDRFKSLLPLYKARNFPNSLNPEERQAWDEFCHKRLLSGGDNSRLAKYFAKLKELASTKLSDEQRYLLEELQLYGESIIPVDAAG